MSNTATSTNTQFQRRVIMQTSNSSKCMPYQVPKKFAKEHNSNNGNTKTLILPNRFENLRLQNDSTNTSFQNNRTDNPSFISNPALVPHESVRMRDQNDKHNMFVSHKSRKPPICTTKKVLQNYVNIFCNIESIFRDTSLPKPKLILVGML